jgi:hypothetical protein
LSQIEDSKNNYPKKKVGLVSFNDYVAIIGDAQKNPITLIGDQLKDKE